MGAALRKIEPIQPIEDLEDSIILDTDSYKFSHWRQYPKRFTSMAGYFCSRGGQFATCTLFGMQYLLHRYLSKGVTRDQVLRAAEFCLAHGVPFNVEGWMHIVNAHAGRLPVRIRAIPEGLTVPTHLPLFTVESTDPAVPWLASHLETQLVRLWNPSTIATVAFEMYKKQKEYLEITADNLDSLQYAVHDFGGRGVGSKEQSRVSSAAVLSSGFRGSDSVEGIRMANHYYHSPMSAFSIVASEHSVMGSWTRAGEFDMVEDYIQRELIDRQLPPGVPKLAACVADTYDVYNFTRQVTSGKLREMIKRSGGKFIERPDSGDPLETLPKILDIARENFGSEIRETRKGYKLLPPYYGLIQGDAIDIEKHEKLLKMLVREKWCVSNLNYGSGGGLIQKWTRDDQRWKYACSSVEVDGVERPVMKDPITDPGKRSLPGRLDLIRKGDSYDIFALARGQIEHPDTAMNAVFEDGDIFFDTTMDEVRGRRAAAA